MKLSEIACGVNMGQWIVFVTLLICSIAIALQEDIPQSTEYDYDDDYYDDPEPISDSDETKEEGDIIQETKRNLTKEQSKEPKIKRDREELTTEKQIAKYEVTELVMDVPDVNTRRIPIITNFTLTRPLNFAGVSKNTTEKPGPNVKDEGDEIINSILVPNILKINNNNQDKNVKGINFKFDENKDDNDYFSKYNPKDSFEEEFYKEFGSDEDDFDDIGNKEEDPKPSKGFKEHFHSFRKSIVNEFKTVVDKHKDGIHDSFRKIVNGPISFFNKLHSKTTDLAKKLHKAVSKHKHHDHDDDIDYHDVDHDEED